MGSTTLKRGLISLTAIALLSATDGCVMFESRTLRVLGERQLDDGSKVQLVHDMRTDAAGRTDTEVYLRLDGPRHHERFDLQNVAEADRLYMRADPEARRTWVVDRRDKRVIFSADFKADVVRRSRAEHPSWARVD